MNVTLNLFSGTAAGAGEAGAGVGAMAAAGPETVPGQSLGAANPFALLLSGQLRGGPATVGAQGLPLALAKAAPAAFTETLPPSGKPLPETVANLPVGAEPDSGTDGLLVPLPWAAALQQPLNAAEGAEPLRLNANGEGNLTLNIMQLALGRADKGAEPTLSSTEPGGDEQALLRLMHPGVVRVEAERAAALLQSQEPSQSQPRAESGSQTAAPVTAAAPATGEAARLADTPRAAPAAQATLPQPLGKQGWDQDLGSRLVWMSKQHLDSAQLRLNPAHLGPLEVRLSIQHDQTANVAFLSNHAPVREAVEAALPRLREMLAESGVNLTDVNVSSHSRGQDRQQAEGDGSPWLAQGEHETDATLVDEVSRTMALGLVDYFA